jgi:hypothetical protein
LSRGLDCSPGDNHRRPRLHPRTAPAVPNTSRRRPNAPPRHVYRRLGSKTEDTSPHRTATCQHRTITLRFDVEPRHNCTQIRTLLRRYALPASERLRNLCACVLTLLPSHKHRLLDITIGYFLTPPLLFSTRATSYSRRRKENGCSVGACIIDPSETHRPPGSMHGSQPIRT